MRAWWRALTVPSVTRRLVLAQMATVALLWISILGYVAWQTHLDKNQASEEVVRQGGALVLPLMQALADQPQELRAALQRLDAFQRLYLAPSSEQGQFVMPRLYAWWDGRLLYRSADAEPEIGASSPGTLQAVTLAGREWLQYLEDSADKRARFAVLLPGGAALFGIELWSRSLLLLPLIISLPLLVLPAWWSVRLALRPWRRVSSEIESRGPDDLSPLNFVPRHRELSPLTSAVNRLLDRLRAARLRERSFTADAAHELRTPIAAMRVHVEALLGHAVPERDRELLQGLLASNSRAGRLVEQLLSLTRSEAAADARTTAAVDFEALVQESLAQLAPLAQAAKVELELESEQADGAVALVQGHAESLRSLIDNIVGNAIKYSPSSGTVRVRLFSSSRETRLSVLDDGPGIPAELRQRVFDRFYRVADQSQPGSGLGLAIAKAVADSHGGNLCLAEGSDGRGLRVVLTLPALDSQAGTRGASDGSPVVGV
jgi:two-component system sensor histidine kinase QseC